MADPAPGKQDPGAHAGAEEIRFPRRMSNWDALMWRMEQEPLFRPTTAAVMLLEKAPPRDALAARLQGAVAAIPRLRQRIVELPALISNPVFAEDPHFDLDYHLRWIRAPRDGSQRALLDLAASLAMQDFDRDRAPWEFFVVEDLADGRAALIQKLHHAVTDGIGGVLLMRRVFATSPETPVPQTAPATPSWAGESRWQLTLEALRHGLVQRPRIARERTARLLRLARRPASELRDAASNVRALSRMLNLASEPLSPLMRARSPRYRFHTLSVPVAALKAAAHGAGCKLNDAYLAAACGGWRHYHQRHRRRVDRLRMTLPINLRDADSRVAGNRITLAHLEMPISIRDPRRRMRAIRKLVAERRSVVSFAWADGFVGLLNLLPPALTTQLFGSTATSIDFLASCVPGPREPLYLAGARVDAIFPFGPTSGTAANLTLFSHGEAANVTINADPTAIPDHEVLADCMRAGFDEVLGAQTG